MAKSKFGNSNLHMTTREFADLVIEALHEQDYFKVDETAHPGDLAIAFSTVSETIGTAMGWAIQQEAKVLKETGKTAMMEPADLKKVALPIDDEIAPLSYSEWKKNF